MSGSSVALDTNWAIGWLNGDDRIGAGLSRHDQFYLPLPVIGELRFGALHSNRVEDNLRRLEQLIARSHVLEMRLSTTHKYADVRLSLKNKGRPLPENDVWIAALCIEHALPLASDDSHFSHIEGLTLIH